MAELLEHDSAVEQEEHGRERWMTDPGARVLLAETTSIIADRLGREDTPESEMLAAIDGVPASIVFEAADRLGVIVRRGVWKFRRRG